MIAALRELGHRVRHVTPGLGGLPLTQLPLGTSLYARAAPLLARLLAPDLVWSSELSLAARAARLGLRVVMDLHAHVGPEAPRGLAAARSLARSPRLLAWAFSSQRLLELVGERVELPRGRCLAAHNGVDAAQLGETDAAPAPRRPLLVHAGHLYPGRGAEELVALARALPEAELRLVGGAAADLARVRALAAGLPNVVMTGHLPAAEVGAHLRAADVLLMPYTSGTTAADRRLRTIEYASPMKMLEYMAAGRPIVATRFPGVMEVLADDVNAVLVAPDSAEALEAGVRAVLADPARAARLAARARADVEARTWQARAKRILAVAESGYAEPA